MANQKSRHFSIHCLLLNEAPSSWVPQRSMKTSTKANNHSIKNPNSELVNLMGFPHPTSLWLWGLKIFLEQWSKCSSSQDGLLDKIEFPDYS